MLEHKVRGCQFLHANPQYYNTVVIDVVYGWTKQKQNTGRYLYYMRLPLLFWFLATHWLRETPLTACATWSHATVQLVTNSEAKFHHLTPLPHGRNIPQCSVQLTGYIVSHCTGLCSNNNGMSRWKPIRLYSGECPEISIVACAVWLELAVSLIVQLSMSNHAHFRTTIKVLNLYDYMLHWYTRGKYSYKWLHTMLWHQYTTSWQEVHISSAVLNVPLFSIYLQEYQVHAHQYI